MVEKIKMAYVKKGDNTVEYFLIMAVFQKSKVKGARDPCPVVSYMLIT